MMVAVKNGQLYIRDATPAQTAIIRTWDGMHWSRSEQVFSAPITAELLGRLGKIVRLPEPLVAEQKRLQARADAIDAERLNAAPEPLYEYPVKYKMYEHQIRGANMALIALGLTGEVI